MRFDNSRESSNVEDRRGGGGLPVGGRSIGIGTIVLALVAMYFGVDPGVVLNQTAVAPSRVEQGRPAAPADDAESRFVRHVLAETEDTWRQIFRANGQQYVDPTLVLFSGATRTACGVGQAAMGPFYCPADQKVYLDLSFWREMETKLGASGADFAKAYVVAHEFGHHVQDLLGTMKQADRSGTGATSDSVRLELQADCYAGAFFANTIKDPNSPIEKVTQDDLDRIVEAARAVGDDHIQQQQGGRVVPESWTHGSSEMRQLWVAKGFNSADPNVCDTFSTNDLGQ